MRIQGAGSTETSPFSCSGRAPGTGPANARPPPATARQNTARTEGPPPSGRATALCRAGAPLRLGW